MVSNRLIQQALADRVQVFGTAFMPKIPASADPCVTGLLSYAQVRQGRGTMKILCAAPSQVYTQPTLKLVINLPEGKRQKENICEKKRK